MTQEQLLQEARKAAEKVYPNDGHLDPNWMLRQAYMKCYIQQADKRKSELIKFLDSIRAYEHESGKAICHDERESEEFVNIYIQQQLKQE